MENFSQLIWKLADSYSKRLENLEKEDQFYYPDEDQESGEKLSEDDSEFSISTQHTNPQIPKEKFIRKEPISRKMVETIPVTKKEESIATQPQAEESIKKRIIPKYDWSPNDFQKKVLSSIEQLELELASLPKTDTKRIMFALELLKKAIIKRKNEPLYSIRENLKDSPLRKQFPIIEELIKLI